MTIISENRLKKKQERKKIKQREKRWKKINSRIDHIIVGSVLLLAGGIAIMEAWEVKHEQKGMQKHS